MEETDGRGADIADINILGGLPKDNCTTTISANLIHYNQLSVVGTTRQSIYQYVSTLRLIEGRKIDVAGLITGFFGLDEADRTSRISQEEKSLKNVFVL